MPDQHQSRSHSSTSPIAEAAIAADMQEDEGLLDPSSESDQLLQPIQGEHSMAGSYRRPSFVAPGTRPAVLLGQLAPDHFILSAEERIQMAKDERNLLRDNHLIPPKNPRGSSADSIRSRLSARLSFQGLRKVKTTPDEEILHVPSETTPLLGNGAEDSGSGGATPNIDQKWEEAVLAGLIETTWQREAKVLARYSGPLIVTFVLQYSLTVASIFTVGHIGKSELGAVSLASSR